MRLLALLLLILHSVGPSLNSEIKESAISFRIRNAGITVNGRLEGLQADVHFDPDHLSDATIQASVPVSTIRTGIALRDRHLQGPDYFYAERFPTIRLTSKVIRKTGRGRYEGVFGLNMKGIEKEVILPFTYSTDHEFVGAFQLNRLDFDLGKSSLVLADEVEVQIQVKVAKVTIPVTEKK